MRARLNGPFIVYADGGADITPKGMKERGLLALLLASPGQRRTRIWLQAMLWSDRAPAQAAGSLRQALANVRKALAPCGERLFADRTTLWLRPEVAIDGAAEGEFLSDLDIRDPEFSDWLRDQRARREDEAEARQTLPQGWGAADLSQIKRPAVMLRWSDLGAAPRSRFVTHAIAQRIASELIGLGKIDVILSDAGIDPAAQARLIAMVEMECFGDGGLNQLLIRIAGLPGRQIVWTGRMSLDLPAAAVWESPEVSRCVNKAVGSVVEILGWARTPAHAATLPRVVRMIPSFGRT